MDLADRVVGGARNILPFRDVSVRSTVNPRNVDIACGVVVASLVAAVVDGACRCALSCRDFVRKRHTTKSRSQYGAQTIMWIRLNWLTIQGRR
jgi:hypothetical protein